MISPKFSGKTEHFRSLYARLSASDSLAETKQCSQPPSFSIIRIPYPLRRLPNTKYLTLNPGTSAFPTYFTTLRPSLHREQISPSVSSDAIILCQMKPKIKQKAEHFVNDFHFSQDNRTGKRHRLISCICGKCKKKSARKNKAAALQTGPQT